MLKQFLLMKTAGNTVRLIEGSTSGYPTSTPSAWWTCQSGNERQC